MQVTMQKDHVRIFFWLGVVGIAIFGMYVHTVFQALQPPENDNHRTFTTEKQLETLAATALVGEGIMGFYQTGSENVEGNAHVEPSFTLSLNFLPQQTVQSMKTSMKFAHVDKLKSEDPGVDVHQLYPSETISSETNGAATKKSSVSLSHEELILPTSSSAAKADVAGTLAPGTTVLSTTSAPDSGSHSAEECYDDVLQGMKRVCRPKCSPGSRTFSLPGMTECRPWLSCSEINADVQLENVIGEGTVKRVHTGKWKNFSVAVNQLRDSKYIDDFVSGVSVLEELSGHPSVIQLIGVCLKANTFITELHPLGNVLTFTNFLQNRPERVSLFSINQRLNFCKSYAGIVAFIHNGPAGTRVMCDSNELGKVHHQLLVTNGWQLILNDLDAMPLVDTTNGVRIACGSQELVGDFVAPEQLWPYPNRPFSASEQPPYDEKADVWKMPDVCDYFLGDDGNAEVVKYNLFAIHKKCKLLNPSERPTAMEVLNVYNSVLEEYS